MSRPFLKDIPENNARKFWKGLGPCCYYDHRARAWKEFVLLVHERHQFHCTPFSNLVLATFEKTFQGNSLVRARWFVVSMVGKPSGLHAACSLLCLETVGVWVLNVLGLENKWNVLVLGAGARPGRTSHAELDVGVCGVIRVWDSGYND